MSTTPEEHEAIKERATDYLHALKPEVSREAVRGTVDVYVKYLDIAASEVLGRRELSKEEIVAHDAAVGLPGMKRV